LIGPIRVGHGLIQRFEFVVQIAEPPAAGNGLVEHRAPTHPLDVLAEVADRELLRHGDVAVVGRRDAPAAVAIQDAHRRRALEALRGALRREHT